MVCKFCKQEAEDGLDFCPFCGKSLKLDPEELETETVEEIASDKTDAPKAKQSVLPLVFSVIAAVAALCALALVLLMAMGVDLKPGKGDSTEPTITESANKPTDGIYTKDVYTVESAKAEEESQTVAATMGDKGLTNVQLQLYYRMQVMDFLSYYGSYASQIGLDYTIPLSEQMCYYEENQTWEQYMIGIAIETWQNYQSLGLLAEEAGFALEGEWLETLEQIPEDLKKQAGEDGYDSADALLKEVIGPGCTEEEYMKYVRLACLSNAYYMYLESSLQPTDDEIDAYFAENEEVLAQNGIAKDMGMISDVRHILIMPQGGTVNEETGETVYSEEAWAEALKKAEDILKEWKDGEATEESFGLLANTYSEDGGSNTTGGLYEDIAPGASYVENFLNWAIDMERQVGDTGIVQTEYGYHIMYYVTGEPYWVQTVSKQLLSERLTEITDGAKEKWPVEINYKDIFLAELKLA